MDNYKVEPQVHVIYMFSAHAMFQKGVCLPVWNAVRNLTWHDHRLGQSSICPLSVEARVFPPGKFINKLLKLTSDHLDSKVNTKEKVYLCQFYRALIIDKNFVLQLDGNETQYSLKTFTYIAKTEVELSVRLPFPW